MIMIMTLKIWHMGMGFFSFVVLHTPSAYGHSGAMEPAWGLALLVPPAGFYFWRCGLANPTAGISEGRFIAVLNQRGFRRRHLVRAR
jgi:hypothetical protein